MPDPLVAILPAAGAASRLAPFRYPKELLPVLFEQDGELVRPKLAAEHALTVLANHGVSRAVVVIADWKLDLVRVLGGGEDYGLPVAFVHRAVPRGLADAVDATWPWTRGHAAVLVLPDTLFRPEDAVAKVAAALDAGADLALGVFPTDRARELGPVVHDEHGVVLSVVDKVDPPPVNNTWGIVAWSAAFGVWLHERISADEGRLPIGHWFDRAVQEGWAVRAVPFPDGTFHDLGTARSLAELVRA